MESNYQTTNQNIFDVAVELADNKKYQELSATDDYKSCDHLIIDHGKKQFFFTRKSTQAHFQSILSLLKN